MGLGSSKKSSVKQFERAEEAADATTGSAELDVDDDAATEDEGSKSGEDSQDANSELRSTADGDDEAPELDITQMPPGGRPKQAWKDDGDDLWLKPEDTVDMRELLRKSQPKYTPPRELRPDAEVDEYVRAHKNKLLRFNGASLSMPREPEMPGTRKIPTIVIVTGHSGRGGNIQVNGIYRRYALDSEDRPVYFKVLEKRATEEFTPKRRKPKPGPYWKQRADQTAYLVHKPEEDDRPKSLQAARECWFLFYKGGFWVIGPEVTAPHKYMKCPAIAEVLPNRAAFWETLSPAQAYARCPGLDASVPDQLTGWETWDVGQKKFRAAPAMFCVKGGDCD